MAYFARLDSDGYVDYMALISNDECLDENGVEQEYLGIQVCINLFGEGNWLQTSYNGTIRKNYAGYGYFYDLDRDAFIPPKPFPSWLLNEDTCQWYPPSPRPEDGNAYNWDEDSLRWIAI